MILTEDQASRISSDGLIHDAERLKELQSLPLERKVGIAQARISEWYNHYNGNVYVSFSGGKDSTVLLTIARSLFPDIKAVYVDTGLEYPEVKEFIRTFDNVEIIRPKMMFRDVITQYGYPLISKEVAECIYYARKHAVSTPPTTSQESYTRTAWRTTNRKIVELLGERHSGELQICWEPDRNAGGLSQFNKTRWLPLAQQAPFLISHKCCNIMKKAPAHAYLSQSKCYPILGTMASESRMRKQSWIRNGCNGFAAKNPTSQPMAFWTEEDVLRYIKLMDIQIPSVYGEIFPVDYKGRNAEESGCKICKWATTGCSRTGCVYCGFGFHNEKHGVTRFQSLAQTHPKLYEYCIGGGQWVDNPYYDPLLSKDIDIHLDIGWNPKQIWVPSKTGLGMGKVFDICNKIYGEDFCRYK